mmetsp:Transcript_14640/g.16249  ORF Transcript_14640/g.16249 Transcript_14640/m.16249 type:complete len:204 (+) Transcript_14640:39-650(+)
MEIDGRAVPCAKIILLGELGVGKTSILTKSSVPPPKTNIGADFHCETLSVTERGVTRRVTLQLWDTAGMERFMYLSRAYYRHVHCCVLVFAVDDMNSFKSLEKWRDEYLVNRNDDGTSPEEIQLVVVGNKIDLDGTRVVDKAEASKYCYDRGLIYIETSAKDGTNLDELYRVIAQQALKKLEPDNSTVSLVPDYNANTTSYCW